MADPQSEHQKDEQDAKDQLKDQLKEKLSMIDNTIVVMSGKGGFIELQGTAEGHAFHAAELEQMLALARKGIEEIIVLQRAALAE